MQQLNSCGEKKCRHMQQHKQARCTASNTPTQSAPLQHVSHPMTLRRACQHTVAHQLLVCRLNTPAQPTPLLAMPNTHSARHEPNARAAHTSSASIQPEAHIPLVSSMPAATQASRQWCVCWTGRQQRVQLPSNSAARLHRAGHRCTALSS
jgi:hypothetical protein